MPHVTLTVREGVGVGKLERDNEALPYTEVRTRRVGKELDISLWEMSRHMIGNGMLREHDGQWVGECYEYAYPWRVVGATGSGRLEFLPAVSKS